ncbi:MAG: class I SAM-dependent methyltransferase [Verrucomicrobiota bacterium]
MMPRQVRPEKLDTLNPDNPDAIRSRRDLRTINRLMGTETWFKKQLADLGFEPRCLEIGAGGGELAEALSRNPSLKSYTAIDQIPPPENKSPKIKWIQNDLLTDTSYDEADVLLASLILHHFEEDNLMKLGMKIRESSIRAIFVSEPSRKSFHKFQLAAGRLIGFNPVTLHDGAISIDAGFRGWELPQAMGLSNDHWKITISETLMGAYRLSAFQQ